ncbi:MAG: hypothetical protein ABH887_01575 [bacterium]
MSDKNLVGFSTGCLYRTDMSFNEKIDFIAKTGANAIELAFPMPEDIINWHWDWNGRIIEIINSFSFVSVHAPWIDVSYPGVNPADKCIVDAVFEKLRYLCKDMLNIQGVVFHPDVIIDFGVFSNIEKKSIFLENMDSSKKSGKYPDEFRNYLGEYKNIGIVIDLFHTLENDPEMGQAEELMAIGDGRISHLHVSGVNSQTRHSLLYLADEPSQSAIIRGLDMMISPLSPIILEGKLYGLGEIDTVDVAHKELEFVRQLIAE